MLRCVSTNVSVVACGSFVQPPLNLCVREAQPVDVLARSLARSHTHTSASGPEINQSLSRATEIHIMWLLSYGTLITPVPVTSPRRGEAAVSAEGQEMEEEEEDEDSLMCSECIQAFASFISTVICPSNPAPFTAVAQRHTFSAGRQLPASPAWLLFFDAASLVNVTFL